MNSTDVLSALAFGLGIGIALYGLGIFSWAFVSMLTSKPSRT